MTTNNILQACKKGIAVWQQAFNSQDAKGCAEQYMDNCVMQAKPFGTFEGKEAIQGFWQNIIDQGFAEVNYTEVTWDAIGEDGYILTSNWTMNKAFGVVHREHWQVGADGVAKLASDDFEVLGER